LRKGAARPVRRNSEDWREQKSFPIGKDEVGFGRIIGDYVFLQGWSVSQPARVYLRGENYFLEDQKSSNGTFAKVRAKKPVSPCTSLQVDKGAETRRAHRWCTKPDLRL
jgi:hypothetical protein